MCNSIPLFHHRAALEMSNRVGEFGAPAWTSLGPVTHFLARLDWLRICLEAPAPAAYFRTVRAQGG